MDEVPPESRQSFASTSDVRPLAKMTVLTGHARGRPLGDCIMSAGNHQSPGGCPHCGCTHTHAVVRATRGLADPIIDLRQTAEHDQPDPESPEMPPGTRRRGTALRHHRTMVTVAQLRQVLEAVDDEAAEVVVELRGTFRPVAGVAVRSTAEHGEQLVVLADF